MSNLIRVFRNKGHWFKITLQIWMCRLRYARKIREIVSGRMSRGKIKVLFLVSEMSKWKGQSLYDMMEDGDVFDPLIVVQPPCGLMESRDSDERLARETYVYFADRSMQVAMAYDFECHAPIDLKTFLPDIVFYQQPWCLYPIHSPQNVARFALACYVPYYVPTFDNELCLNCQLDFHRLLFRYFVVNKSEEEKYRNAVSRCRFAGKVVGLGQPFLDYYNRPRVADAKDGAIVYAPHWTFSHPKNSVVVTLSTFLQTGRPILEYAKSHSDQHWIFKPHPALKSRLIKSGAWTASEVSDYYEEWERVGSCCYTSDYLPIFSASRALVTDCDGFLMEYPPTGHPLIRLIPDSCDAVASGAFLRLLDAFYEVRNLDEMEHVFAQVLERGEDPNQRARQIACNQLGVVGSDAAMNICRHLEWLLRA